MYNSGSRFRDDYQQFGIPNMQPSFNLRQNQQIDAPMTRRPFNAVQNDQSNPRKRMVDADPLGKHSNPLAALLGLMKGVPVNVEFEDRSTAQEHVFDAMATIEAVTYKGTGSTKKEAKQRMATVILRDRFQVDAVPLLQSYFYATQNSAKKAKPSGPSADNSFSSQGGTQLQSGRKVGLPMNNADTSMDTSFTEDFDPECFIANRGTTYSQEVKQEIYPEELLPQPELVPRYPGNNQMFHQRPQYPPRPHPGPGRFMQPSQQYFSRQEVMAILNENMALRRENEMLRAKLSQIPIHSRLGPAPGAPNAAGNGNTKAAAVEQATKFDVLVDAQPTIEPRAEAFTELLELKKQKTEEMVIHTKKLENPMMQSDKQYFCVEAKFKESKHGGYKFYGRGPTKDAAQQSSATLAVNFLNRVFSGEKLIPLHEKPNMYLNSLLLKEHNVAKPSECMTVVNTPAVKGGEGPSVTVTLKLSDYEITETATSGLEAKNNISLRALKDLFGYVPY